MAHPVKDQLQQIGTVQWVNGRGETRCATFDHYYLDTGTHAIWSHWPQMLAQGKKWQQLIPRLDDRGKGPFVYLKEGSGKNAIKVPMSAILVGDYPPTVGNNLTVTMVR